MHEGFEKKLDPADPHEVFSSLGEKITTEERKRIEEERMAYYRTFGATESNDELKFINFDYYETVYRRIAEKSGLDPAKIIFLRPDRILLANWKNQWGSYDQLGNFIVLNDLETALNARKIGLSYNGLLARLLFHEEIHATAKVVCIGEDSKKGPDILQSGYHTAKGMTDEDPDFFWFNEGVTDLLASEIFQEYVVAEGQSSPDITMHVQKIFDEGNYKEAITLVRIIINKISNSAGIPKEVVWHALIRGAYSAERFEDPELRRLFDETVGSGMLEKIRKLGRGDRNSVARLAEEIEKNKF